MATMTFEVEWRGEPDAGLLSGSETVTIELRHTPEIDADTVEYFRDALKEFYDGATVMTTKEFTEAIAKSWDEFEGFREEDYNDA